MDRTQERDKPWRPADYPAPGPSWEERPPLFQHRSGGEHPPPSEHKGEPDAED